MALTPLWHWKAALLSGVFRSLALGAALAPHTGGLAIVVPEFVYRVAVGGFWGAMVERVRMSPNAGGMLFLVAVFTHALEFVLLRAAGLAHIRTGMFVSIAFSMAALFLNLFAMRRGVLLVGENAAPLLQDLRRIPALLAALFPRHSA